MRAQQLNNLGGKIIRIDPETGQGIGPNDPQGRVANPFWNGNPGTEYTREVDPVLTQFWTDDPQSKIWEYGLRNPFRFTVRRTGDWTGPGTLLISDVGYNNFEEIDIAPRGGMNFGWPCHEGSQTTPLFP